MNFKGKEPPKLSIYSRGASSHLTAANVLGGPGGPRGAKQLLFRTKKTTGGYRYRRRMLKMPQVFEMTIPPESKRMGKKGRKGFL